MRPISQDHPLLHVLRFQSDARFLHAAVLVFCAISEMFFVLDKLPFRNPYGLRSGHVLSQNRLPEKLIRSSARFRSAILYPYSLRNSAFPNQGFSGNQVCS